MVNKLEGYAEYAVQKKLKAKDRMPVVASAALMVVGLAIWTFIAGWVGPSILIIGIALTIITATRQELEYEYIFVNGDCEISKIVKRSSRKKVYEFEAGKIQKVLPYTSILFDNERQAHPDMIIRDYTSCFPDRKEKWYAFINNSKNRTEAVIVELNDKCIEHVKLFYKNKYSE